MADISKIKFNNVTYSVKDQTARDKMITESITYDNLVFYKATSRLIPGKYYRITDYVTTTALEGTQSAGHQFDIIVRADDVNKLNENAYAALHSGDTYFANSKLEAWELKYRLDNDSRFAWADSTNGKGVIYYMKDEFYNECTYDFKNILFKRYKTTKAGAFYNNLYFGVTNAMGDELPNDATLDKNDYKYFYTFTIYTSNYIEIKDASLNTEGDPTCYQNVIPACNDPYGDYYGIPGLIPNNIVFQGLSYAIIFENSFGGGCCYNTIGPTCHLNTIGSEFIGNTVGDVFNSNIIGASSSYNTIGYGFSHNTIGNGLAGNNIETDCAYNTIGNDCTASTIGKWFNKNFIGNYFDGNTIGNNFQNNTIRNSCTGNTIGNNFESNIIGNGCYNLTIAKNFVKCIEIEDGNNNITLTSTQTTSVSNYLQNICISRGVNNSENAKTISHDSLGDTFKTTYQPANSQIINV